MATGVLLCGFHHAEIHQSRWSIIFAADGRPEMFHHPGSARGRGITNRRKTTRRGQDRAGRGYREAMLNLVYGALDVVVGALITWFAVYVVYRLVHEDR